MKEKNEETVLPMTVGQLKDIIATMVGSIPNLTKEDAKIIIGNKGKLVDGIKKVFNQFTANNRPIYAVTIDYSRTLAEMIKAGKYNWVNSGINEKNFPLSGEGKSETDIVLFHFNKNIDSDKAIALMDKEGYRPAVLEELLAIGEKYPDLQKEFPIIALGSVWRGGGGFRGVRCLFRDGAGRVLNLGWFGGEWGGCSRFAAVRK